MEGYARHFSRLLLAPALLPLLYVPDIMYPLMAPKTLALRGLFLLLLAFFAYGVFAGEKFYWSRLKNPVAWIPGALLFIAYASSLAGIDFFHSFWSTFERGDGLLSFTASVGFFYAIVLAAESSWLSKLLKAVAWVGSFGAAYLVLQWAQATTGIDLPGIVQSSGRVGGLLGNAAFYSAYAAMALFAILAVRGEYDGWKRTMLSWGVGLSLVAIVLAATRGTFLALFLIGIAVLAYLARNGEGKLRRYSRTALLSLAALALLGITFRSYLALVPFEPVQRLATISLSDPTVESRLFIWRSVLVAPQAHSILGMGAEHVDVLFNHFYDPSKITEEWFDRTHNAYLDYLVQFGFLGVALYLALVIAVARLGYLLFKGGDRYGQYALLIAAVYALQNFFVFDTASTLWFLLALFGALLAYRSRDGREALFDAGVGLRALGAGIGLAALFLFVPVVIQPARANLLAYQAYLYQVSDVPRAKAATDKGMALDTYADLEFGYNAYFIYTENQLTYLSGQELQAAYENARDLLLHSFARYPYDARTATYLAQVLANAPALSSEDRDRLDSAVARAIELSPKRVEPWYILANQAISGANVAVPGSEQRATGYSIAKQILQKYIEINPDLSEPHFVLAELDIVTGDASAAVQEAAAGKAHYRPDIKTARRAVSYYGKAQDLHGLEFFLAEVARLAPTDYAARYDLAKAKYVNGDPAAAAAIVEALRKENPQILATDPDFLAAITAYERQH